MNNGGTYTQQSHSLAKQIRSEQYIQPNPLCSTKYAQLGSSFIARYDQVIDSICRHTSLKMATIFIAFIVYYTQIIVCL